jgi:hypothetical protein
MSCHLRGRRILARAPGVTGHQDERVHVKREQKPKKVGHIKIGELNLIISDLPLSKHSFFKYH